MIPPHSEAVLQRDGSIVRGACWCDLDVHIDSAEDDEGNTYVYPHTVHGGLPMFVACVIMSDFHGPPI